MKGFNVLGLSECAINFVSMMTSYSGLIRYLPTNNLSEIDSIKVYFHENTLICALEIDNVFYESQWNGNKNSFAMASTEDPIDPQYICGFLGDYELEMLYDLFVNRKPIVKGNRSIKIVEIGGVPRMVSTNCTLESLVADESYFGKNPV